MRKIVLLLTLIAVPLAFSVNARADIYRGLCTFPVDVTFTSNKEIARTILPSGVIIVTGQVKAVVTNVDNNKSLNVNVSGPVFDFTSVNGTVIFRGEALIGNTGFLILTSGTVVFSNGQVVSVTGKTTDLCAVLADP
jgi:hypothetical protein